MECSNAFAGKAEEPTHSEVAETLGAKVKLWDELIEWMREKEGVQDQEWKRRGGEEVWMEPSTEKEGSQHRLSQSREGMLYGQLCSE
jgi:hypothetical protein